MTDRAKIEALLVELDDSNTVSRLKNEQAASAIRSLLADNDYFRQSPNFAFYAKGLDDRKKLIRIEGELEKVEDAASRINGEIALEGSGEYHEVRVAEEVLGSIRRILDEEPVDA